ncbi:MAG: transketolase [Cellvibrionaceae bacterium]
MSTRNELANAIRALSMDAVQQANSGHPGAPMGMADIAEVLWNDYLIHNPANPQWPNRDRFILSNGHGSMLLYSLLHLSGYDLSIEDIKQFRQLGSKTPGHPEYHDVPGAETTTGPLGQGFANAVGMAMAEKILAAQFNRDNHTIVDHSTYVFLGDGCLMEGISHEAASLAGTHGLGKLIAFYDDNGISIDGEVEGWFTDDTPARFESYNWHVVRAVDGHDSAAIKAAIEEAKKETDKPTIICCKTVIGFGSPNKQGKESCHGAPLGAEEITLAKQSLGWQYEAFDIPNDIYSDWDAKNAGSNNENEWQTHFDAYQKAYPELAEEFERRVIRNELPKEFSAGADQYIQQCQDNMEKVATRKASQNCLESYGKLLPELLGGSADLAGSNLTKWSGSKGVTKEDASGNYLFYGVREFAMTAIGNGICLHGGFVHYSATFLVFMEYARNAVRMAALMHQPHIFVYTHDSIGLGEDGPTHQPIEQIASLRSTPNLHTWRPCDTIESAVSWKLSIENNQTPSALIFSRQGLPAQPRSAQQLKDVEKGGYILKDCSGQPDVILIATGSEVELAINASDQLQNKKVRVVSMPCAEIFEQQSADYKESVLPANVRNRVAIEAAHQDYWYKYVGLDGKIIGMSSFGASGPGGELMKHFGFTVDNVVATVNSL